MIQSAKVKKDKFIPRTSLITLTTDFGQRDGFVGAMKGVILGINADARIVDISHGIPPQDIRAAAFVVASTMPYFPSQAIHVVVVDPGVGSRRKILAAHTDLGIFLVPDNGLLSLVDGLTVRAVYAVENSRFFGPHISHTFHGRDVFAPVAGHLSLGVSTAELGPEIDEFDRMQPLICAWEGDTTLLGHVVYVDRFGNLITNVTRSVGSHEVSHVRQIRIGDRVISKVSPFYADVQVGSLVAVWGSHGRLEIAINGADASRELGVGVGETLWISIDSSE